MGHTGKRGDYQYDRRDRRIDQPRPVHGEAAFRSHAVLIEIEPALAADQVADFDEAHQAVIVATKVFKCLKTAGRLERKHRDRGDDGQPEFGFQARRPAGSRRDYSHFGKHSLISRRLLALKPSLNGFNK
jgi:hypothetical protein